MDWQEVLVNSQKSKGADPISPLGSLLSQIKYELVRNSCELSPSRTIRHILNRAKKVWIWVKSVHFCHFRQLPNSTMTLFVVSQHLC